MTTKDFQLIADVVKASNMSNRARAELAVDFAMRLRLENERFNPSLFFTAAVGNGNSTRTAASRDFGKRLKEIEDK